MNILGEVLLIIALGLGITGGIHWLERYMRRPGLADNNPCCASYDRRRCEPCSGALATSPILRCFCNPFALPLAAGGAGGEAEGWWMIVPGAETRVLTGVCNRHAAMYLRAGLGQMEPANCLEAVAGRAVETQDVIEPYEG